MYKECNVVMLSTDGKAEIVVCNCHIHKGQLLYKNGEFISKDEITAYDPQHLYITSDETPKANDWCINDNADTLYRINGLGDVSGWNKVIATTDTSLNQDVIARPYPFVHLISQSFIEHFITEYNKGNVISKVMVEYEDEILQAGTGKSHRIANKVKFNGLAVNPNNTINIKLLKDNWNRDEVIGLIKAAVYQKQNAWRVSELNTWIDNNL